jgi:eukaryotic-like serine/threonine-protein kinase
MAEVWRATLTGIGGFQREVAVKLLRAPFAQDEEFIEMLLDEARIAGAVAHSNVVQMLDVGREGQFYVVMEYVAGESLRTLLRRAAEGRIPLEHALYVAMETAQGLGAVHGTSQRIVHRDVSPSNVLLSRAGEVKLSDFGVARAESRLARTRAGSIKGKLRYMAPEQVTGQTVDARADLYALCVSLAEMLVGPSVWEGPEDTPGPGLLLARASRAHVPDDVMTVLRRGLESDPERRFPNGAALRRALAEPLYMRQPGYGEAQLAAYIADPTVPPSVVVRHATPSPPTAPVERVEEPPTRNLRARLREVLSRVTAAAKPLAQRLSTRITAQFGRFGAHRRTAAIVGSAAALVLIVAIAILATRHGAQAAKAPPAPQTASAVQTPTLHAEDAHTPTGRLAVYGPTGQVVKVDGVTRGRAPTLIELPAGRHRVAIGKRAARIIVVAADRTSEVASR